MSYFIQTQVDLMLRLLRLLNSLGFCCATYNGNVQCSTIQRTHESVLVSDLRTQNTAWRFETNKLFWRFQI